MSYLKNLTKMIGVLVIALSFFGCKKDGGFKAANFSVKDAKDNAKPGLLNDSQKQDLLTAQELERLAQQNEQRSDELQEEIALKNEVITSLQVELADTKSDIKAVQQEIQKLTLSTSAQNRTEELKRLGVQVSDLKDKLVADRQAYSQAINDVSDNDQELVKSLTVVINEINKLKAKEGKVDEDLIADIERRFLGKINTKLEEEQNEALQIESEIVDIERQLTKLNDDIRVLEDALNQNPPDSSSILESLNKKKQTVVKLEEDLALKVKEKSALEANITSLNCALNPENQTCIAQTEEKAPQEAPTDVDQKKKKMDDTNPDLPKKTKTQVTDEEKALGLDAKKTTITDIELGDITKDNKNEAAIFMAKKSISDLEKEAESFEVLKKKIENEIKGIDDEIWELRSQLSQDHGLFMARTASLRAEKNKLNDDLMRVQQNIKVIRGSEIPAIQANIANLQKSE